MSFATIATPEVVTVDAIREAAARLRQVVLRTPLLPVDELTGRFGVPVYLKPESLQRAGAFKFRGAYNYVSQMDPAQRSRGLLAPSSGNHAQAVALAAKLFGVHATVVMPTTVTPAKKGGCERLGATVVLAGTTTAERMGKAMEIAKETGATIVPPYDDPWIIAGQGTAGLEIVEDLSDVGTVLVPVGGGGLSAGIATAVKSLVPNARIVGIEPACAPKLSRAREAGRPVPIPPSQGLADGLLAVQIGTLNFAHHQRYIDDVVTVEDSMLRSAMRFLLDRMKLVVEPSGAITLAALMEGLVTPKGTTVVVLSGGNIEWDGLRELLSS